MRAEIGKPVKASDLNRLSAAIPRRIIGGDGIAVTHINGTLVVSLSTQKRTRLGIDQVYARITSEVGGGIYNWANERGDGPVSGTATEFDLTTGIGAGDLVVLYRIEGDWWFQAPASSSGGPSFATNGSASGLTSMATLTLANPGVTAGAFDTGALWDGAHTDRVKVKKNGIYEVGGIFIFTVNPDASTSGSYMLRGRVEVNGGAAIYDLFNIWVYAFGNGFTGPSPPGGALQTHCGHTKIKLSANDYVRWQAQTPNSIDPSWSNVASVAARVDLALEEAT